MAIISDSIPNFINGISQQPFAIRLASQAEEQINGMSSVVEGLTKRPPTKFVKRILTTAPGKSFIHIINRDPTERYVVILLNGDLKVYDFNGNEKTVNFPNGKGYLASAGVNFSAVTVADYTFIVNKDIAVEMHGYQTPIQPPQALLYVRQGNYATDYRLYLNGTTHTKLTGTTDANEIQTSAICGTFQAALAAHEGGAWFSEQFGSTLRIARRDGADFTANASDSLGDTAMILIKSKVQSFTSLPARAVEGYQVTVEGSSGNPFSTYYLEYKDPTDTAKNVGIWKERARPGRKTRLNGGTLPHSLVREANGSFTFKPNPWAECFAGDETTVPEPSFVGRKIGDIFFYRNRLGLIADESVVLSRSADFFNFWRASATDLLDTDPIDVAVSHNKVAILRHAVPFNESLILFSDQTQFAMRSGDVLTPAAVAITQSTEYEASLKAKPVGVGSFVYFPTARGGYSGIRDYFVQDATQTNSSSEATGHVPRYIEGNIFKLSASTNEDILIALSDTKRNAIYVHKFYFSGGEKVQSSWSRWELAPGDTILNAEIIESTIWLVVQRAASNGGGVFLERMDIQAGHRDDGMEYAVLLDRRASEAQVTKNSAGRITLPWPVSGDDKVQIVARAGDANYPAGKIVNTPVPYLSGGQWYVDAPANLTKFYVGVVYTLRYTFSPFLLRQEAPGGGQVANTEGRIQVRRVTLNYAASGYFRIEVTPTNRRTYTSVFTGRVLGSGKNQLGVAPIETGSFKFPVMAHNMNVKVELVNDSPMPCRVLNADWEALYTVRSTKMS